MHRLHYSGESLLLTDAVCEALLGYAAALAEVGRADTITIPVLAEPGQATEADILVGPASQLMAIAAGADPVGVANEQIVLELNDRTARLGPSHPPAEDGPPWSVPPGVDGL